MLETYCQVVHNRPSELARFLPKERSLVGLPLRASNEGLLRPRVARAQETTRPLSPLCLTPLRPFVTLRADSGPVATGQPLLPWTSRITSNRSGTT
jgi:hypothetical protein